MIRNRKTCRRRVLDVEGLRELLDLTNHDVRALIANNATVDDFPCDLFKYTPRVGRHAPLSADRGAR